MNSSNSYKKNRYRKPSDIETEDDSIVWRGIINKKFCTLEKSPGGNLVARVYDNPNYQGTIWNPDRNDPNWKILIGEYRQQVLKQATLDKFEGKSIPNSPEDFFQRMTPTTGGVNIIRHQTKVTCQPDHAPDFNLVTTRATEIRFTNEEGYQESIEWNES